MKVLSYRNGDIESKVLFIAEAPGRLGADRTGIPLHGDRTGEIFESLLGNIGWDRNIIFITNAVLCNPRKINGNNGTPTSEEIANCSSYLRMTIELIQPQVLVPLGISALYSLSLIHPHAVHLKEDVAKLIPWYGKCIFPLYHPGPRALVHRSLIKQRTDYMQLAKRVDPLRGIKTKGVKKSVTLFDKTANIKTPLQEVALLFIKYFRELSLFKLMKLLYLTDLMALKQFGRTISGGTYLREQEGPWNPKVNAALTPLKGIEIEIHYKRQHPFISIGPNFCFDTSLQGEALEIVSEIINKYGALNNASIKSVTYLTEPMKYILKQERCGKDMRHKPIIYKDKTAVELLTE